MPKSYNDGCLLAHALDLIGDRWVLLIVRELMLGPKRFGAIRAGLPAIATNILTQRLEEMTAAGLIVHKVLPPPATVPVYDLTPAGLALLPVVEALCHWGGRQPGHDPRRFISPTALMLSMRAVGSRQGAPMVAGFDMGDEAFEVRVGDGDYAVARVAEPQVPLRFAGPANGIAALVYGPRPVAMTVKTGPGRVTGDLTEAQEFVNRFRLPT